MVKGELVHEISDNWEDYGLLLLITLTKSIDRKKHSFTTAGMEVLVWFIVAIIN